MAGQHVTASPLLPTSAAADGTKANNLQLSAATVGRLDAPHRHHHVSSVFVAISNSVMAVISVLHF